jgi:hypothetical protein
LLRNGEEIMYFLVPGSNETIVQVQLIRMSSGFTFSPSLGALATCKDISIELLPVAYVTCPLNSRSHISFSGFMMVILSNAAVTVVTPSPVCLYAITPDRASRSMKRVPSLSKQICQQHIVPQPWYFTTSKLEPAECWGSQLRNTGLIPPYSEPKKKFKISTMNTD